VSCCVIGALTLGASGASAEVVQYEVTGIVTSSLVGGVVENDPVSIIFEYDPTLAPNDFDDRGDEPDFGSNDTYDGATLISATFSTLVYTSPTSAASQTVFDDPDTGDEYYASWEFPTGPTPDGSVADLLTLLLDGGDDPISASDPLPSVSELDELATEGFGVLRFQNPVRGGLSPTIVFNVTGGGVVPTPGSAALLGLGGIVAGRRRRTRRSE